MDVVATVTVDLLFSPEAPELVNVVHPRPVPWRDIMNSVNAELEKNLPYVPLEDWVKKVEDAANSASAKDLEDTVSGLRH